MKEAIMGALRMAAKQNPDRTAIMYINNFEELKDSKDRVYKIDLYDDYEYEAEFEIEDGKYDYIYITMDPESMREYNARQRREKQEGIRGSIKPGNDSYILVLDYDLNLIKSYLSDSDISNLALTSDPSVVYATNSRENRLIKYTLPGLN